MGSGFVLPVLRFTNSSGYSIFLFTKSSLRQQMAIDDRASLMNGEIGVGIIEKYLCFHHEFPQPFQKNGIGFLDVTVDLKGFDRFQGVFVL